MTLKCEKMQTEIKEPKNTKTMQSTIKCKTW